MSTSDLERRNIAVSMRKSVENLVISSQDAIGQSISQALTFSGVVAQQSCQGHEGRSVSRSPSPSPRNIDCSAEIIDSDKVSDTLNLGVPSASGAGGDSVSVSSASDVSIPPSTTLKAENLKTSSNPSSKGTEVIGSVRAKKKSWYNALYPTYKSKCEDFRRLFKDLPDDERLIVDYSCAIQKDILLHGRLYASQNYLCFYSSIFGWETSVTLRWKEVTAITKEKTALVIPNAILVCTEVEKNFLTSFSGRDKAYLMLFRIWQNALMDQPMSSQEIWAWVHSCYGEELGFNSDDEEYTREIIDEAGSLPLTITTCEELVESSMETSGASDGRDPRDARRDMRELRASRSIDRHRDSSPSHVPNGDSGSRGGETLPTDMSETSDSEHEHKNNNGEPPKCTQSHDWRQVLEQVCPFPVDELFTMLFTKSRFNVELLAARLVRDYTETAWQAQAGGDKSRQVTYKQAFNHAVGPKEISISETQVMHKCSKAGMLYSINSSGQNGGIPYAEYFTVEVHYCMKAIDAETSHLSVYAMVKYIKNTWGMIKSFIEKNAFEGLSDCVKLIGARIRDEATCTAPVGKQSRRRRRAHSTLEPQMATSAPTLSLPASCGAGRERGCARCGRDSAPPLWALCALALLLAVNALLYWKLYHADTAHHYQYDDLTNRMSKLSVSQMAEWSALLEQHSARQRGQLLEWRDALDRAVSHLAQTEQAMLTLLESIKPSLMKGHPEAAEERNEL